MSLNPIKQFSAAFKFGHAIRYTGSTAGVNVSVTRAMLLNTMISNVNSTVNSNRILQSILVKRIRIVGGVNAHNSATAGVQSATLEWNTQYGPNANISDTTVTQSAPLLIDARPPLRSLASFWSTANNNESEIIFTLNTTTDVVVDVHYTYCLSDLGLSTGNVVTAVAGIAGALYYTALDGPRVGAIFLPISLPSLN